MWWRLWMCGWSRLQIMMLQEIDWMSVDDDSMCMQEVECSEQTCQRIHCGKTCTPWERVRYNQGYGNSTLYPYPWKPWPDNRGLTLTPAEPYSYWKQLRAYTGHHDSSNSTSPQHLVVHHPHTMYMFPFAPTSQVYYKITSTSITPWPSI